MSRQTELLTAGEIHALAHQALTGLKTAIDRDPDQDDVPGTREHYMRVYLDVFRAMASLSLLAGDAGFLPMIERALFASEYSAFDRSDYLCLEQAIKVMCRHLDDANDVVARLATRSEPILRGAVAMGLRPVGPRAIAVLNALARDLDPSVRKDAIERLGPIRQVAWWEAGFTSDPISRLNPDEASRAEPDLRRLATLLDGSAEEREEAADEVVALIARVPPVVGLEVASRVCAAPKFSGVQAIAAHALQQSGGVPWLIGLIDLWVKDRPAFWSAGDVLDAIIAATTGTTREALCRALVERTLDVRGLHESEHPVRTAQHLCADAVRDGWPSDLDPSPYLERTLDVLATTDDEEYARTIRSLWTLLRIPEPRTIAIFPRCVEAFLAGFPAPWDSIWYQIPDCLRRLPTHERRELVDRALASTQPRAIDWGVEEIVGSSYDAARDGDPYAMVGRLLESPSILDGFVRVAAESALPYLRERLRAGQATLDEALATMHAIGVMYGGVLTRFESAEDRNSPRRPRIDAVMEGMQEAGDGEQTDDTWEKFARLLLGPAHLRGVPTEEEWAAYHRLRATVDLKTIDDDLLDRLCNTISPVAPLNDADRACLAEQVARLSRRRVRHSNDDDHLPWGLMALFNVRGTAEHLPLIDVLLPVFAGYNRNRLLAVRATICRRAGIDPTPPPRRARATAPDASVSAREWMDEADED